jgi:nucleotide-binding universal stress UspA family protein
MFKRIVVPVDFSASSLKALDAAVDMAAGDTEVVVVHAVEPLFFPYPTDFYAAAAYDQVAIMEEVEKGARQRLGQIAVELRRKHVRARTVTRRGSANEVIVETAKKEGADLIVISTHGRTGLAHVLMGSVAEKVARHAPCAVLVVRGLGRRRRTAAGSTARRSATSPRRRAARRTRRG